MVLALDVAHTMLCQCSSVSSGVSEWAEMELVRGQALLEPAEKTLSLEL